MPTSDNWLDLAAAKGSTKWLKQFIRDFLPQLVNQQTSAQDFAQALDQAFQDLKLSSPKQQKNYRSNIVQALKTIDANHPAIALVSLTTEQYRDLSDEQRGRTADRSTKYFTSTTAETLVQRATSLLDSAEWSDVGAGLAVLIGRRVSEILLSQFSLKSSWSLSFSDMAKKPDAIALTIEIPTLAPADQVLNAIQRLQNSLKIQDLKLNSLSPKTAKQAVNNRFSAAIANRCDQHFADLIPLREDRDNLYTHIFRAVYATVATHWFCPPTVPEHRFKAEIQGHFTIAKDGSKRPNFSARANYDDYAISTQDGNRDGRLGIKLGKLPNLQIIDAFNPERSSTTIDKDKDKSEDENIIDKDGDEADEAIALPLPAIAMSATHNTEATANSPLESLAEITPMNAPQKPKTKRPELLAADVDRMTALMAKQNITGSAADLFHALLNAFDADVKQAQQQQTQTFSEVASTLNWFTSEIQSLRDQIQQLTRDRDHLLQQQSQGDELDHLKTENAQLKSQLSQTQDQLKAIQQIFGQAQAVEPQAVKPPEPELKPEPSHPNRIEVTPEPQRRNEEARSHKLNQIVDALLAHNTAQEHNDLQLRVSIPVIKALASLMGANYQAAIQQVLKDREAELIDHHNHFLLGTRHNASVKNKEEILRAIAHQYLGLDNWQDVKYQG